jgi:hypothetical protein
MNQHDILTRRFHDSPASEWPVGIKPRAASVAQRALRMREDQFASWARQYQNGEIFAEWQLIHSSDEDLADRIQERWPLWWVTASFHPDDIGMLWAWTAPSKASTLVVMHPDDVTRVRKVVSSTVYPGGRR